MLRSICCGLIYFMVEIIFKRHTTQTNSHVIMWVISSAIFYFIFKVVRMKTPKIVRILFCTHIITSVELLSGYTLWRVFGLRIWNYDGLFGSLHGFICVKYTLLWLTLSTVAVVFYDLFKEKNDGKLHTIT